MDLRWGGGDVNQIRAIARELIGCSLTSLRQAGPRPPPSSVRRGPFDLVVLDSPPSNQQPDAC
jgi:hypothetical protein